MNYWGHFKTITVHKLLVMKYCFKIGLYKQGLLHDLSKYTPTEFLMGARYYQGTRSPNNAEREETGISTAWIHHKGRNKHHFEYWVDYGIGAERVIEGMPMPKRYIAEMIMDRISASYNYHPDTYTDRSPLEYYNKGKEDLWFIHEDTKEQLEYLLKMLAVKGEKQTLHYIKNIYLKNKGKYACKGDTYTKTPWDYEKVKNKQTKRD